MTILTLALLSSPAHAFSEDLCYGPDGYVDCNATACQPGNERLSCQVASLRTAANMVQYGGRSVLHTDATYAMALEIGFDEDTAYMIAAYDQATDLAQYVPHGADARPVVDVETCAAAPSTAGCDRITREIEGFDRMSPGTGGTVTHFPAVFRAPGDTEDVAGQNPDVHDAQHETVLANLRQWVHGEGPACAGGLSEGSTSGDYATGETCPRSGVMTGAVPVLGYGNAAIGFEVALGDQIVHVDDDGTAILAANIGDYVGADVADAARLGIYLHAVQDRVSHHICGDDSTVTGPDGYDFTADYGGECGQGLHMLRHTYEIGWDEAGLPSQYRTVRPALEATWDELSAFAVSRGLPATSPARRDAVVGALVDAIGEPTATERVIAIASLVEAGGYAPMPGF